MGLLSRLKEKVKEKVGAPKAAARPADGTHDDRDAAARTAAEAASTDRKKNAGEDKPWYLDGANDGWDETNPEGGPAKKS